MDTNYTQEHKNQRFIEENLKDFQYKKSPSSKPSLTSFGDIQIFTNLNITKITIFKSQRFENIRMK